MAEARYSRSRYDKTHTVAEGVNRLLLLQSLEITGMGGWGGSITALAHGKALHMGSK